MFKLFKGLLDSNEREIKKLQPYVDEINRLEPEFEALSDPELRAKTDEFRSRLSDGTRLDDILPEAFAAVREAAKRTIRQRHFDVQLMGGFVLHRGKIAEMKTGEGKTLVATLPAYLNALTGEGCHLVTVNDYLARRDCRWMGPIYHALGVSVASINAQQTIGQQAPSYRYDPDYESEDQRWAHMHPVTRREAYEADITYGTNNEFGFDYLRDNMVLDLSQCVQRELNYAIVDEVDNILIDEARTPLIISGARTEDLQQYRVFTQIANRLERGKHYEIDEKTRTVTQTEEGMSIVENTLRREGVLKGNERVYGVGVEGDVDDRLTDLQLKVKNALIAKEFYKNGQQYVVTEGKEVVIVDEFTGRLMFGRRYSEGLHQAIEAKERVKIQQESVTLATITFQNYFRLYQKLAGMTGTAVTEAEEFHKIYNLEVVIMPTNKPMIRIDHADQIYKDERSKFAAVAGEIKALHDQGRPVLVGTTSIEQSDQLADILRRTGIVAQVLNAKHHEKEAEIVADAGRPGSVTVATQMAGRGVDIILGGNPEKVGQRRDETEWREEHDRVVQLGGLHIIGTEHHEARRIDNQLRGRAGRQGDPGSSRFYASLEDEIVRRFGGDRVSGLMQWAGMDENTPIEHPIVSKAMGNAQVQTEGHNFSIRKQLVEYDDVINKHREVIYAERKKILSGADLRANILSMIEEEVRSLVTGHMGKAGSVLEEDRPDLAALMEDVSAMLPLSPQFKINGLAELDADRIAQKLTDYAVTLYEEREREIGADNMRFAERLVMLRVIDRLWMEHLTAMEELRQGIGLRAVAQEQPLIVYKKEGQALFDGLLAGIQHDVAQTIYRVGIAQQPAQKREAVPVGKKVGRNDPCSCGSGKKYKHCCGK